MSSDCLASKIRDDFPILSTTMSGKPLIYFDNGATTQKPRRVIDALVHYYTHDNANIHRGLYELSQRATDAYEAARKKVAKFLNAAEDVECIFVAGTTEAANFVAQSWGEVNLQPGDEVIVTGLEHHSNIVPWQMACQQAGAELKVWYSKDTGELELAELKSLLSEKTKLLAVQHVSNALGVIHDIRSICELARRYKVVTFVDGAQWVAHGPTDVQEIGCDFYAFSAHKLFGPTGVGVLWGRKEQLQAMPPYQGGGDMIETVQFDKTTYAELPNRHEAGTPDIAGVIGLGAAIDYVNEIGFAEIQQYEKELLDYATEQMQSISGLRILGTAPEKAAVLSFVLEEPSIASLDIASFLSNNGIAIRTGHHCCMPLMHQLEVSGTSRVSLAMYNTKEEVDVLITTLAELVQSRSARGKEEEKPSEDSVICFATAKESSVQSAADALADEFLEFDDRESKTELLMELGEKIPDHFEALKKISTAVPGCMSEVYLVGRPNPEAKARFEFVADSNAHVVRGLIAVLQHIYSGQAAQEVIDFELESFFRKIGLDEFVSTQRRSGLNGMVGRIKSLAQAIVDRETN